MPSSEDPRRNLSRRKSVRLTELGWNAFFEGHFAEHAAAGYVPARVSEESKGFYRVLAEHGEWLAQITGGVRHRAGQRGDFPAVGDWVAVAPRAEDRATIMAILPRRTVLARKVVGRVVDQQILAANLDVVFIVAALNQEFNVRRIERYITLVWESGAQPVVLLNKADLCADAAALCAQVQRASPVVPVHTLSATTGHGLDALRPYLGAGRTAALVGSSGVGKSTILNVLLGASAQRVGAVRAADDRGRHTTASRQMIVLPDGGGILVDTPGMRELQLWDAGASLAQTFQDIGSLAPGCKFRDCQHNGEPGCAVEQAIVEGSVKRERLENYHKMEAELRFVETKVDLDARRTSKARVKKLCKAQEDFYKE
jgi:ribosome biogenesis GTPase / thiamine phosphate phosphatase